MKFRGREVVSKRSWGIGKDVKKKSTVYETAKEKLSNGKINFKNEFNYLRDKWTINYL